MNGVEKENTLTPQEHHNAVKLMNVDTTIPEEAPPSRMPQEPRREGYMKPARSAAQPMLLNEISSKSVWHLFYKVFLIYVLHLDHNNRYGPRQGDQEPSNARRQMIRPPMAAASTQPTGGGVLDTLKRLFCSCCP